MPRKRIETGLKPCAFCGNMFERRPSEALWQFGARACCSRSCAGRVRIPKTALSPKTRYRMTKRNGQRKASHRLVVEQSIQRPLQAGEIVHHKDGNKLNNDLSNLEIVTAKKHAVIHLQKHAETYRCAMCGKPFIPHKTKRGRKKNCSPECFREYQKHSRGKYVPQQVYPFFQAIAQTESQS